MQLTSNGKAVQVIVSIKRRQRVGSGASAAERRESMTAATSTDRRKWLRRRDRLAARSANGRSPRSDPGRHEVRVCECDVQQMLAWSRCKDGQSFKPSIAERWRSRSILHLTRCVKACCRVLRIRPLRRQQSPRRWISGPVSDRVLS